MQRGKCRTTFLFTHLILNHQQFLHTLLMDGTCDLLCLSLCICIKNPCVETINFFDNISEKKPPLPAIPCLQEQLPYIDWTPSRVKNKIKSDILIRRAKKCLQVASHKKKGKNK